MSSDGSAPALAIAAQGVGKCYDLFDAPGDRLKQVLWGRWRREPYYREFWALKGVDFQVAKGEVLGVVGRNGAGKSTLLQMVCGTLEPSTGTLAVTGRVAALLELGAGFNPDFTGRENVYMNAAILGLKRTEVDARLDDILAFADIGTFIDQPVKTYSSGMFMRLAFSVATSVEPDILVIDEALSVGDGAFARKSFDRIMGLKNAGKTILFCSHSMYQVEALCSRALWIEHGALRMAGTAAEVTAAYGASLDAGAAPAALALAATAVSGAPPPRGSGRILKVLAGADGVQGHDVALRSGLSDLSLVIEFTIDPTLPTPGVAVGIADSAERTVASAISVNDGVALTVNPNGQGRAMLVFGKIGLLKGRYAVTVFLTTEDGVHPYDQALHCVSLQVTQQGIEQGVVSLPHVWHT
jgi:lipopolysaccharide transport system ATP-binding protein